LLHSSQSVISDLINKIVINSFALFSFRWNDNQQFNLDATCRKWQILLTVGGPLNTGAVKVMQRLTGCNK